MWRREEEEEEKASLSSCHESSKGSVGVEDEEAWVDGTSNGKERMERGGAMDNCQRSC